MTEAWNARRKAHVALAGGVFAGGCIVTLLLLRMFPLNGVAAITTILAIGIAALVGAGKQASP